jgi:hypothetical protein
MLRDDRAGGEGRRQAKALRLQKQLLDLAGWPSCRQQYAENLREAEEDAAYCRERFEHPPAGEYGTGTDPQSRRERLEDAIAEVEYRRELLEGLEAVRAKWAPKPTAGHCDPMAGA